MWSYIHYVHGGKAQIKYIQLQKFHSFVGDSNAWLCFSIIVIICFIFSLGASVYWALSLPWALDLDFSFNSPSISELGINVTILRTD